MKENKFFLFLGRLSAEKNPIEFAECVRDLDLPALFVGDGEYLDKVKKTYPQAVFTGWLEKENLYEYIKQARCLVFPSSWYETQGLSVQEMASWGIPAIVSDVCAAKEMIVHGVNGWIYESGNKDSLKKYLLKMTDDLKVRDMGKQSYELVKKIGISEEKYIEELLIFYQKTL
ncbi:glycosyltransferase, group 1 family protein [Selenomonas sputigena ATCC 35185]|uniref:Glycosyltransferase, group 1 family protein n=1 Tax=Selenomonas sputigena (strain ATCC 35185 / DSM 20758 / CCUG 44933 / VPI D19B-28) TaxID=546271 RepID=C9LV77_SELS3|nr:glycosyltransferase, group 1 family protein [Selenomonas sputigena ATCC 35185]